MSKFYHLLSNSLVVNITNFFVWSSVVYWVYLGTHSVLAVSIMSGIYLVITAVSGFWFGSIVDHTKKKTAMLISSVATLILLLIAFVIYISYPIDSFATVESVPLWIVVILLLLGVIAGNIRGIVMPTLVTLLVPEDRRDKANGMVGMVFGVTFAVSSVAAGFGLGFFGMKWVLISAIVLTVIGVVHLLFISLPAHVNDVHEENMGKKNIDVRGTIKAVRAIPGLFPLIFFTTFNNFLGGIFMSLMDAYGLTLVSVQVWGTIWGVLSFGFIVGGMYIAKYGLGKNPVRTLFNVNLLLWTVCIFMTIQPSIVLLAVSILIYLTFMPFIEASEHTIIQKVVPVERQGRVFGFAQSVEQAASPVTAFLIGPIAQFIFIPLMTTGAGVDLIGSWYGVGEGRGIGLVFTIAGILGVIVTVIARRSRSSKNLSSTYAEKKDVPVEQPQS